MQRSRSHGRADRRAKPDYAALVTTPAEREDFEIGRFGVHWPEIDEDIELAGLPLGAKAPGAKAAMTLFRAEAQSRGMLECKT
jgi:hypothetical protein